ncbi:MAG: hypothetical protein ABI948_11855 [Thermoleophilia bacterium]
MTTADSRIWIGLVEVRPAPGSDVFGSDPGAYANVLALAADEAGYRRAVVDVMPEYGAIVVKIDDVETFDDRLRYGHASEQIVEAADELGPENPVSVDRFYIYEEDEEDEPGLKSV